MTEPEPAEIVDLAVRRVREAINAQHEAVCRFAVENGLSPTEIVGCHQSEGTVYRFWLERIDEKDPEKVAFFREENYRLRKEVERLSLENEDLKTRLDRQGGFVIGDPVRVTGNYAGDWATSDPLRVVGVNLKVETDRLDFTIQEGNQVGLTDGWKANELVHVAESGDE
jgi:hypothetical protein